MPIGSVRDPRSVLMPRSLIDHTASRDCVIASAARPVIIVIKPACSFSPELSLYQVIGIEIRIAILQSRSTVAAEAA